MIFSRLNTQPMAFICQRFLSHLTVDNAQLTNPYRLDTPYPAQNFHPLFLAGLSRRTKRQFNPIFTAM
jgi:hypothetical protein